ncbi:MAG: radical SAM/SPASM domain-containing protein [Bacteroidota bacterium]
MDWIRLITLQKLIHAIKIYIGYVISMTIKKTVVLGKPASLTIEPTNICNLQCPECPTGNNSSTRAKGHMDFAEYTQIIDQLSPYLLYHMLYFQGEPFLNPDFFKMLKYAHDKKIYTCTSTNGHFLTPENATKIIKSGLNKIIISVDGTDQNVYEEYRKGGDLKKVITGIKTLSDLKKQYHSKSPKIVIQFLVFRFNQHQIKVIKKTGKEAGANRIEIKSAQIEQFEQKQELIPTLSQYSRYKILRDRIIIKNKLKNRCFRLWSTMVITWDGDIIPCCFDKDASYKMGNIKNKDLISIWFSEPFNRFRKKILHKRKTIEMCRNCTSGLR